MADQSAPGVRWLPVVTAAGLDRPPSHRRRHVAWIDSAKRDETRQRRLDEAIRLLEQGKPLGSK